MRDAPTALALATLLLPLAGCLVHTPDMRGADHVVSDRIHEATTENVTRTYRFEVPPGTERICLQRYHVFTSETTETFGPAGEQGRGTTYVSPESWRGGSGDGHRETCHTGLGSGPMELRITTKGPTRYAYGFWFH